MLLFIKITEYGTGNENDSNIKFEAKVIKSNLCDYLEAYILETGDMTAIGGNADTKVTFKTPAPFTRCVTHINDEHIDTSENIGIIITMCTYILYSDNYSDTSGSLWHFKIDESTVTDTGMSDHVSADNSSLFRCKWTICIHIRPD